MQASEDLIEDILDVPSLPAAEQPAQVGKVVLEQGGERRGRRPFKRMKRIYNPEPEDTGTAGVLTHPHASREVFSKGSLGKITWELMKAWWGTLLMDRHSCCRCAEEQAAAPVPESLSDTSKDASVQEVEDDRDGDFLVGPLYACPCICDLRCTASISRRNTCSWGPERILMCSGQNVLDFSP